MTQYMMRGNRTHYADALVTDDHTHTHTHTHSLTHIDIVHRYLMMKKIPSESLDLEKIYKKNPQTFDEEKIPTESLDLEKKYKKILYRHPHSRAKKNEFFRARIFTKKLSPPLRPSLSHPPPFPPLLPGG